MLLRIVALISVLFLPACSSLTAAAVGTANVSAGLATTAESNIRDSSELSQRECLSGDGATAADAEEARVCIRKVRLTYRKIWVAYRKFREVWLATSATLTFAASAEKAGREPDVIAIEKAVNDLLIAQKAFASAAGSLVSGL